MASRFRPMLSATLKDVTRLRFPLLASPKYDGIRCVIRGGRARTRSLKPIPNLHIRSALERLGSLINGFDGEIMLPYPATFPAVSSAVMARDVEPPSDWFYVVFDRVLADVSLPFVDRLSSARRVIESNDFRDRIVLCAHERIFDADGLVEYEATALAAGHEGVMVRSLDGPYKFGRATLTEGYLSKLKRFCDSEAEIVDVIEMEHNRNAAFIGELGQTKRRTLKANKIGAGIAGKLVVRDLKTGVVFKIGTGVGLTLELRRRIYQCRDIMPGKIVRYRFQGHGVKDKPRIASLQGFRDWRDMDAGTK